MVKAVIDIDGDVATVTSHLLIVSLEREGLPIHVCHPYHDRLVRDGERGLFAERRIESIRQLRSPSTARRPGSRRRATAGIRYDPKVSDRC
jgi:hypothetical protein